jgi:hypothetical protein
MSPNLQQMQSPDPQLRAATAAALGKNREHAEISALILALRDPEFIVQRAALIALGSSRDPRGLYPLNIIFCNNDSRELRLIAGSALAEMGDSGLACIVLAEQSMNAELRRLAEEVRAKAQNGPGFAARWDAACIEAKRIEAENADPHRYDGMPGMGEPPREQHPVPASAPPVVTGTAGVASGTAPVAATASSGLLSIIAGMALLFFGAQFTIWGGLAVIFVVYDMTQGNPSGILVLIVMGGLAILGLCMIVFGLRRLARLLLQGMRNLWRPASASRNR